MMKALILSAGFGTRLHPITHHIPKPLIPVGGLTLLDFHIAKLASYGIKDIVINTHHLHTKIKKHVLSSSFKGVRFHLLHEKDILGTGGAVKNAEHILKSEPFLLVNSDIVYDFDLAAIMRSFNRTCPMALMVLKRTKRKHLQRVLTDRQGQVVSIGKPEKNERKRRHLFTGIHIISPDIFSYIPRKKFCCINSDIYRALIREGRTISSCFARGYWNDSGLPASYRRICRDFLNGKLSSLFYRKKAGIIHTCSKRNIRQPVFISHGAKISPHAGIGPNAWIMSGAFVPDGAIVKNAVLLPGTQLKKGEVVRNQIRYKHCSLTLKK